METKWIPTNEIYHTIINTPDAETRERLFTETFIAPFTKQFSMMGGAANLDSVRRLGYLMPEDLTTVPDSLRLLEAADAWTHGAEALKMGAARWEGYDVPLEHVTGYIVLQKQGNQEGFGYAGAIDFVEYDKFVVTYDRPDARNIRLLSGAVVHELHHLVRGKVYPINIMTAPLAEYIAMEGLAESFAGALYGDDHVGPYVTSVTGDDLERARALIGSALDVTGFNTLRGYVFGDATAGAYGYDAVGGMPTFGGYAVGYHAVQAYLKRTGKSIEEATFVSGMEIMRESGYFAE